MNKIKHLSGFQIIFEVGVCNKWRVYHTPRLYFALKCSIRVHLMENGIEIVLGAYNLRFVINTTQLLDTCWQVKK